MDQIDPPRQTVNISVLFNAFETFCFPHCVTDMSQVYFSSVNVRKSCGPNAAHKGVQYGLQDDLNNNIK